jgi:hypothetical protein
MDVLLKAVAIVGYIVIYHNGPKFLVPKKRPFNCPLCMSFWLSLLWLSYQPTHEHALLLGIAPVATLAAVSLFPWAFASQPPPEGSDTAAS